MAAICPDGHPTEDTEYCEECGLRVPGVRAPAAHRSTPPMGPGGGSVPGSGEAAPIGDTPTSAHTGGARPGAPPGAAPGADGRARAAPGTAVPRSGRSGAERVPASGETRAGSAAPSGAETAHTAPAGSASTGGPAAAEAGPTGPAAASGAAGTPPDDLLEQPAPTLLLTPGRRPRHRGPSTVARLRLLVSVTVAALVLAFGALAAGTRAAQTAIDDTGQDTGPRIIATADLPRTLAETDAHLAALVLLGDDPEHADERSAELEAYQDSGRAAADLVLVAHDLALDVEGRTQPTAAATDPAAAAIEGEAAAEDPADAPTPAPTPEDAHGATARAIDLAQAYGRYRELAGRALALSEDATYPAGEVPGQVVAARAEAARHLREEVLPLAEDVSLDATRTAFHRTKDARDTVVTARAAVAVGSAAALAALIVLQVFLARRFRRTFSPALLVATAVTAIYTYTGVTVMATQTDVLERMTFDGLIPVATQATIRTEDTVETADSTDARTGTSVAVGSLEPYRDDPAESEEAAAVFTASVAAGDAALGGLGFLIPVSMLSIAVVAVVGTAPRLAEYR
ncbi:hypothetical protein [Nocardiopsis sp. YSL2]|uniref:hypothetical protein n=1 Tax=Nocardiopsis sp. YSL2 TaxID=2939492 RepID=UPI0026F46ABC|nr:hypothetical protein [Nocardiopsis sp. YSL2]